VRYLLIIGCLLTACTVSSIDEEGYDESLWNLDQTGWACEGHRWNIWLYYDDFEITTVNTVLSTPDEELMWSKTLPLIDTHYYQDNFIELARQCRPYDVKYTIYFLHREPKSIWLYWNENRD